MKYIAAVGKVTPHIITLISLFMSYMTHSQPIFLSFVTVIVVFGFLIFQVIVLLFTDKFLVLEVYLMMTCILNYNVFRLTSRYSKELFL